MERYISHFGPLNQRITLANHTVWLINAPGLVDEDRERAIAGMSYTQWAEARPDRTIAFVQSPQQSTSSCSNGADHHPFHRLNLPLSVIVRVR